MWSKKRHDPILVVIKRNKLDEIAKLVKTSKKQSWEHEAVIPFIEATK